MGHGGSLYWGLINLWGFTGWLSSDLQLFYFTNELTQCLPLSLMETISVVMIWHVSLILILVRWNMLSNLLMWNGLTKVVKNKKTKQYIQLYHAHVILLCTLTEMVSQNPLLIMWSEIIVDGLRWDSIDQSLYKDSLSEECNLHCFFL